MINNYNKSEVNTRLCLLLDDSEMQEDPRTASLRRISYGIILPAICCLGIVGNIFNLVVLTRKNMRGTAYIYMRASEENIKFLHQMHAGLSKAYEYQEKNAAEARISDDHCIYFPKSTIAYIEKRTENAVNSNFSDWKNLVKEALIEVYGNNISRYCAKGTSTRTDRLPINSQLYDAIYGYSAAALLAILFCIPFALRVLIHKETGRWSNWPQAFYHAHLELFLGNGCLGVGVMMLLALTIERYVSVCHPGQHTRPLCGPPYFTVSLIPLATFLVYLPSVFKGEVITCLLSSSDSVIYQKRDNSSFMHSIFYQIYKVVLEVIFKVAPTILLAGFNLRIMIVYRKSCERRRKMTSRIMNNGDDDSRSFAEERRLVLLLSSTSILFLICVSPMVILNVTLSESNLTLYSYQMFRALANLLEVTNYSITFYIYCLFSKDFRNTLIRTIKWPWCKTAQNRHRLPMKRSLNPRPTITTSPPTTTVATPGHVSRASV